MTDSSAIVLAAKDPSLIEAVQASALALGVPLDVVQVSDELARRWPRAPLRLVAPEMAGRAAWLGPLPGTYLVGRDAGALAEGSAELGVPVLLLPEASGRLADLLAQAVDASPARATTIAVSGASGGLGTSTLAVGLGLAAVGRGGDAVVVELAERGGGLDLLLGQETSEGMRWSDLAGARGELGNVVQELVVADGLSVLALSRDRPGLPDHPARQAVLGALRRSTGTIIVDAGAGPVDADVQVLVVGADVRSVAAARMATALDELRPTGLVVRTGAGRTLPPGAVADALGAPLLGELRTDAALPRLAELGQPPLGGRARRFKKDVKAIWGRIHG